MFRTLATAVLTASTLSLVAPAPGAGLPSVASPAPIPTGQETITPLGSIRFQHEHQSVTVRGMIDRVVTSASENGSHLFLVRDEYGHTLRVRSTGSLPDRRVMYEIAGSVSVDRAGRIYLSEEDRSIIPLTAVESHTRSVQRVAVIRDNALGGEVLHQTSVLLREETTPQQAEREAGIPGWAWILAGIGAGLIGLMAGRARVGGPPAGAWRFMPPLRG